MLRVKGVAILLALLPIMAMTVSGQQDRAEPTHLALEIRLFPDKEPSYSPVQPAGAAPKGMWTPRFRRTQGWKLPEGDLPVSDVYFKSVLAGDVVRVWVSVFVGRHELEKPVTSFTLREGEKASVTELTQFGVEPAEVGVIRVAPGVAAPAEVVSRAKSIQPVTIEATLATLPKRKVTLRNLSSKNVSALGIDVLQDGRSIATSMPQGFEGEPLIVAGGVVEIDQPASMRAKDTSSGYVPESSTAQTIEIRAAVFEDGSFEGDFELSRQFRGFVRGRRIQLARVTELMQKMLADEPLDPGIAIESLKQQIIALPIIADPDSLDEYQREFPVTGPQAEYLLRTPIEVALKGIRRQVLEELNEFQVSHKNLEHRIFRDWLQQTMRRYQAWASRAA